MADRQRFELWVRQNRTPVFKTGAFNHSAICPCINFILKIKKSFFYLQVYLLMFKKKILLILLSFLTNITLANADIIKDFKITGNNRVSSENIIKYSGFKIGQNVSEKDLSSSLKKIYLTNNFADISLKIDHNILTINVLETPIIGDIFFIGSNKFNEDEVKKSLSTKSRQIYSKSRIKLDAEKLQITFRKMGFLNTIVEPRVVFLENNSVDVIFNINEGEMSYVKKILFEGNNNYSAGRLKDNIVSKTRSLISFSETDGAFLDSNLQLDKDMLQLFYQNHGYAKVEIADIDAVFDKMENGYILTYRINEGDIYKFGNSKIVNNDPSLHNDTKLEKLINIRKGRQFSMDKILDAKRNITTYLKSIGYNDMEIAYNFDFDENNKTVNISFVLQPTQKVYIDKITLLGNNKTKNNIILREMMIHEGDLYDKDKIELSKDRIYMLGYFKNVEIKEKLIDGTDLMELEIVVEEQFFGHFNFSIGYSGYYGIVGSVTTTINNFLGRGFTIGAGIERNGYMETYSANFYDPYIFTDKYNVGLGINASFSRFGDLGGGTQYTSYLLYKGYSYNFGLSLSFELATRLSLSIGLSASKYKYNLMGGYGYKLYEQFLGSRNSQILSIGLTYNKQNRARFATKGYLLQYTVNFGGLGFMGGQQFIQNTINANGNLQIFDEDLILHTEASAGIVNNLNKKNMIGMENLFTLGGYYRMRGFDFYGIGPRIQKEIFLNNISYSKSTLYYAVEGTKFYYLSAELRSPLFIPKDYGIYFSAFIDAGSVWGYAGKESYLSRKEGTIQQITGDNATTTNPDTEVINVSSTETVIDSNRIRVSAGLAITWNSPLLGEIGFYYAKPLVKHKYDRSLEFGIRMGRSF